MWGHKKVHVPEGWLPIAFLPKEKYIVVEEAEQWVVYQEDDHGVSY